MTTSSAERNMLCTLFALTAVTGMVDAVSFLALGHVFTANMTGNVVFLGFAVAGAHGTSAPRSVVALVVFLIGAGIGGRMAAGMSAESRRRWIRFAFGAEVALLLAATLMSIGQSGLFPDSLHAYLIIGLTALAMGVRNATIRKLTIPDMTTTVLTLTLTGLAADSSFAGGADPRWKRRVASTVIMFAGAAVGALLLRNSMALALGVATVIALGAAVFVDRTSVAGAVS